MSVLTSDNSPKIGQAEIMVAKGGEICSLCRWSHEVGELYAQGMNIDHQLTIWAGIFCLDCWHNITYHPDQEEVRIMPKENGNGSDSQPVKGLQDTKLVRLEWEATHADLENQDVVIHSATPVRTQYGDAYVCQVEVGNKEASVLFGGSVLVEQITAILDDLPVLCRVEKPAHYFLLVEAEE